MKKVVSLVLIFVMCLSLCACDNDTGFKKEDFVGTWLWSFDGGGFVFNSDGTATTNYGLAWGKWKYNKKTNRIETIGGEYDIIDDNGVVALRLREPDTGIDNGGCADQVFYYYKEADYDKRVKKVELTLDNWQDYFEFVYEPDWRVNDFNEATEFIPVIKFQVRDDLIVGREEHVTFYKVVDGKEGINFSVEISCKEVLKELQVDLANQTYAWGEAYDYGASERKETGSVKSKETDIVEIVETEGEIVRISTGSSIESKQGYDIVDYDVTRIQGYIYVVE